MERKINISLVIATLAIVLAIGVAMLGGKTVVRESVQLGGDTNYDSVDVSDGYKVDGTTVISGTGALTIGTNGSANDLIKAGTCSVTVSGKTVTATTTTLFACAVTGVSAGDQVKVWFATSTSKIFVANSSAYANVIEFEVYNASGANLSVLPVAIASSVPYIVFSQ